METTELKSSELNLLILDDNTLIGGPLSQYLHSRFGQRINLSMFIDAEECMRNINKRSHVLILNYSSSDTDDGAKNRGEIFKTIKRRNPKAEVTMLTSKLNILGATEELQRRASDYIRKKERYIYDVLLLLKKVVFVPVKTYVILPVRRIANEYKINFFVLMILTSFVSVGLLVVAGYQLLKLM